MSFLYPLVQIDTKYVVGMSAGVRKFNDFQDLTIFIIKTNLYEILMKIHLKSNAQYFLIWIKKLLQHESVKCFLKGQ